MRADTNFGLSALAASRASRKKRRINLAIQVFCYIFANGTTNK